MITGRADFNKYVSIESLEYGEEDGSGDAAFTNQFKRVHHNILIQEKRKKQSGREKSKKEILERKENSKE